MIRAAKTIKSALVLLATFALGVGAFGAISNLGWLIPFGIGEESHDTQVINAIERTQEVSLLSLGIQGLKEQQRCREVRDTCVWGTTETTFLQYAFDAKLGIDGAEVKVEKSGTDKYSVSVPAFRFIGYDEPTFRVAVEDGGVLSWVTPDIDKVEMINEILNDDARQKYIENNAELLQDQTQVFYESLITSVAPEAETTFEFTS